jgi:FG-GAP-like repeat
MGMLGRYASVVFVLFIFSSSARPQTSPFFVPPSYPGTGQTVTADFNKDGKPDLAFADGTVLLGNGDGTFTTAASLSVTGENIVAGDFNADGKPDVIVTSGSSTILSVLLETGPSNRR